MARKRMHNDIRTDYLEGKMAHYLAMGNTDAYNALAAVARDVSAPIDVTAIHREADQRRSVYFDDNQRARIDRYYPLEVD